MGRLTGSAIGLAQSIAKTPHAFLVSDSKTMTFWVELTSTDNNTGDQKISIKIAWHETLSVSEQFSQSASFAGNAALLDK